MVGSVWSGEKAVEFVRDSPPDLVTLDLNMPGRGGLETLSEIRQLNASRPDLPPVGVVLVSALTERGAAITVEGLARGAFDFIRKPDGPDEKAKSRSCGSNCSRRSTCSRSGGGGRRRGRPAPKPVRSPGRHGPAGFRPSPSGHRRAGPRPSPASCPDLTRQTSVPLFIVQHLPQGMTRYFADSLGRKCAYRVVEASDGEAVEPGPPMSHREGGTWSSGSRAAGLSSPSTTSRRRMAAGPRWTCSFAPWPTPIPGPVIAIILTGMGTDGAKGLGPLKRSGAYVIAQDEATSVVWGMPGAAVATNQVDEVLPLEAHRPGGRRVAGGRGDSP